MPKQRTARENGAGLNGLNGLSGSTRLRLRNQIERAHRQCFGAEQGLRVLVKLATSQMLATGSSRTAIRHALVSVVSDCPADPGEKAPRTAALTAMMLSWSDRTSPQSDGGGTD